MTMVPAIANTSDGRLFLCASEPRTAPPLSVSRAMPKNARDEYTQLRVSVDGSLFFRTLFARAHVSKGDDAELPTGQTLFLLNMPHAVTVAGVKAAFKRAGCGAVSSVKLSDISLPTLQLEAPTRDLPWEAPHHHTPAAHVVFASADGLKKALNLKTPLQMAVNEPWGKPVKEETHEELRKYVDTFMKKFEAEEKQRQADEEARHNQMDSDGFVMVSRKRGRSTATEASTGATVGVVSKYHEEHESASSKKKKKKNKGELVDFYHFQQVRVRSGGGSASRGTWAGWAVWAEAARAGVGEERLPHAPTRHAHRDRHAPLRVADRLLCAARCSTRGSASSWPSCGSSSRRTRRSSPE